MIRSLPDDIYRTIVDNVYEGVYFVDLERCITYWNKGAERITGYSAAEVIGRTCADNILMHIDTSGRCLCTSSCPLTDSMQLGSAHSSSQFYFRHKEGHRVAVEVSVSLIRAADGTLLGAVEIFSEKPSLDQERQLIDDLKREALIDILTGLPNRRYLQMTLTGSLAEYDRHGIGFGVVFADVDHFKQFNDNYGHDLGDRVLKLVGNSMTSCMRAYDMVGRWGGEEFLAIIRFSTGEQFRGVAEKLRAMVASSFIPYQGEQLSITITLGATRVLPDDSLESLVNRADRLMYEGKRAGRNRVYLG